MGFHKMKPSKSLAKRVRITRRGKVMRGLGGHSHRLSTKNAKRRRRLRTRTILHNAAMSARLAKVLGVYAPTRRPEPRDEAAETPAAGEAPPPPAAK
jgi:ribosomal protein L35